jgi:LmbE family N-acetylglucosaminyl deacetylase
MKIPQKNDRILVLAPHPDDEILAAGGYIYTAIKNNAQVRVVIVTHGESFGYAMGRRLNGFLPIKKKCVLFGKIRQKESTKILMNLGLLKKDIIFLGFPDKGLRYLWKKNWSMSTPYRDPLLKTTYSPFPGIYQSKIVFSGEALEGLLDKTFDSFKPNQIIFPSKYDDHPDHKALFNFTQKLAIGKLKKSSKTNLYSFLIHKHRFLYPFPYGLHPEKPLKPPLILNKKIILWQKFVLSKEAILSKGKAILSYQSQFMVMGGRLLSFLKQNELFEEVNVDIEENVGK